jgi:hypothetical protein
MPKSKIADDSLKMGYIDSDTDVVTICGYDAKSRRLPTMYENIELGTHFTQHDQVFKRERIDSGQERYPIGLDEDVIVSSLLYSSRDGL